MEMISFQVLHYNIKIDEYMSTEHCMLNNDYEILKRLLRAMLVILAMCLLCSNVPRSDRLLPACDNLP